MFYDFTDEYEDFFANKAKLDIKITDEISIKLYISKKQKLLMERIECQSLSIQEKNYLTICRYYDCQQIIDQLAEFLSAIKIIHFRIVNPIMGRIKSNDSDIELLICYKVTTELNQYSKYYFKVFSKYYQDVAQAFTYLYYKSGIKLHPLITNNWDNVFLKCKMKGADCNIYHLFIYPFFNNVTENEYNNINDDSVRKYVDVIQNMINQFLKKYKKDNNNDNDDNGGTPNDIYVKSLELIQRKKIKRSKLQFMFYRIASQMSEEEFRTELKEKINRLNLLINDRNDIILSLLSFNSDQTELYLSKFYKTFNFIESSNNSDFALNILVQICKEGTISTITPQSIQESFKNSSQSSEFEQNMNKVNEIVENSNKSLNLIQNLYEDFKFFGKGLLMQKSQDFDEDFDKMDQVSLHERFKNFCKDFEKYSLYDFQRKLNRFYEDVQSITNDPFQDKLIKLKEKVGRFKIDQLKKEIDEIKGIIDSDYKYLSQLQQNKLENEIDIDNALKEIRIIKLQNCHETYKLLHEYISKANKDYLQLKLDDFNKKIDEMEKKSLQEQFKNIIKFYTKNQKSVEFDDTNKMNFKELKAKCSEYFKELHELDNEVIGNILKRFEDNVSVLDREKLYNSFMQVINSLKEFKDFSKASFGIDSIIKKHKSIMKKEEFYTLDEERIKKESNEIIGAFHQKNNKKFKFNVKKLNNELENISKEELLEKVGGFYISISEKKKSIFKNRMNHLYELIPLIDKRTLKDEFTKIADKILKSEDENSEIALMESFKLVDNSNFSHYQEFCKEIFENFEEIINELIQLKLHQLNNDEFIEQNINDSIKKIQQLYLYTDKLRIENLQIKFQNFNEGILMANENFKVKLEEFKGIIDKLDRARILERFKDFNKEITENAEEFLDYYQNIDKFRTDGLYNNFDELNKELNRLENENLITYSEDITEMKMTLFQQKLKELNEEYVRIKEEEINDDFNRNSKNIDTQNQQALEKIFDQLNERIKQFEIDKLTKKLDDFIKYIMRRSKQKVLSMLSDIKEEIKEFKKENSNLKEEIYQLQEKLDEFDDNIKKNRRDLVQANFDEFKKKIIEIQEKNSQAKFERNENEIKQIIQKGLVKKFKEVNGIPMKIEKEILETKLNKFYNYIIKYDVEKLHSLFKEIEQETQNLRKTYLQLNKYKFSDELQNMNKDAMCKKVNEINNQIIKKEKEELLIQLNSFIMTMEREDLKAKFYEIRQQIIVIDKDELLRKLNEFNDDIMKLSKDELKEKFAIIKNEIMKVKIDSNSTLNDFSKLDEYNLKSKLNDLYNQFLEIDENAFNLMLKEFCYLIGKINIKELQKEFEKIRKVVIKMKFFFEMETNKFKRDIKKMDRPALIKKLKTLNNKNCKIGNDSLDTKLSHIKKEIIKMNNDKLESKKEDLDKDIRNLQASFKDLNEELLKMKILEKLKKIHIDQNVLKEELNLIKFNKEISQIDDFHLQDKLNNFNENIIKMSKEEIEAKFKEIFNEMKELNAQSDQEELKKKINDFNETLKQNEVDQLRSKLIYLDENIEIMSREDLKNFYNDIDGNNQKFRTEKLKAKLEELTEFIKKVDKSSLISRFKEIGDEIINIKKEISEIFLNRLNNDVKEMNYEELCEKLIEYYERIQKIQIYILQTKLNEFAEDILIMDDDDLQKKIRHIVNEIEEKEFQEKLNEFEQNIEIKCKTKLRADFDQINEEIFEMKTENSQSELKIFNNDIKTLSKEKLEGKLLEISKTLVETEEKLLQIKLNDFENVINRLENENLEEVVEEIKKEITKIKTEILDLILDENKEDITKMNSMKLMQKIKTIIEDIIKIENNRLQTKLDQSNEQKSEMNKEEIIQKYYELEMYTKLMKLDDLLIDNETLQEKFCEYIKEVKRIKLDNLQIKYGKFIRDIISKKNESDFEYIASVIKKINKDYFLLKFKKFYEEIERIDKENVQLKFNIFNQYIENNKKEELKKEITVYNGNIIKIILKGFKIKLDKICQNIQSNSDDKNFSIEFKEFAESIKNEMNKNSEKKCEKFINEIKEMNPTDLQDELNKINKKIKEIINIKIKKNPKIANEQDFQSKILNSIDKILKLKFQIFNVYITTMEPEELQSQFNSFYNNNIKQLDNDTLNNKIDEFFKDIKENKNKEELKAKLKEIGEDIEKLENNLLEEKNKDIFKMKKKKARYQAIYDNYLKELNEMKEEMQNKIDDCNSYIKENNQEKYLKNFRYFYLFINESDQEAFNRKLNSKSDFEQLQNEIIKIKREKLQFKFEEFIQNLTSMNDHDLRLKIEKIYEDTKKLREINMKRSFDEMKEYIKNANKELFQKKLKKLYKHTNQMINENYYSYFLEFIKELTLQEKSTEKFANILKQFKSLYKEFKITEKENFINKFLNFTLHHENNVILISEYRHFKEPIKKKMKDIYSNVIKYQREFYFYLGQLIVKMTKMKFKKIFDPKTVKKYFDINSIINFYEIGAYSSDNGISFYKLAHFYKDKVCRFKKFSLQDENRSDKELFFINLKISAYFNYSKATLELKKILIKEEKYLNALYGFGSIILNPNDESLLVNAKLFEHYNSGKSIEIYYKYSNFDINTIKTDKNHDFRLYLVLLGRIGFFKLIYKYFSHTMSLDSISNNELKIKYYPIMSRLQGILKTKELSNSDLIKEIVYLSNNFKFFLEDFTVSNTKFNRIKIENEKIMAKIFELRCEAEYLLCEIELNLIFRDPDYQFNNQQLTILERLTTLFYDYHYYPASLMLSQLYFEISTYEYNKSDEKNNVSNNEWLLINSKNINYIRPNDSDDQMILNCVDPEDFSREMFFFSYNNSCFERKEIMVHAKRGNYYGMFHKNILKEDPEFNDLFNLNSQG